MGFELFFYLVYLSISSFALAFEAYVAVLRLFGDNKWIEMIVVPFVVVAFDFMVFALPQEYRYFVPAIPLAALVGILGYAHFFKKIPIGGNNSVAPSTKVREEKKYSAKSARIHAAREKRGHK